MLRHCHSIKDWLNKNLSIVNAAILFLTAGILFTNANLLSRQINLTKLLNQPLCAVKEVQVIKTGKDANGNVFGVYIILKNFGNYVARNVSYEWNTFAVENEVKNGMPSLKSIKKFGWLSGEKKITLIPQSEHRFFITFIGEKTLKEFVVGYEKFIKLNIITKFKNFKNKQQQYTCNYLITRLQAQTNTDNPFDVMFNDNNLIEIPQ